MRSGSENKILCPFLISFPFLFLFSLQFCHQMIGSLSHFVNQPLVDYLPKFKDIFQPKLLTLTPKDSIARNWKSKDLVAISELFINRTLVQCFGHNLSYGTQNSMIQRDSES